MKLSPTELHDITSGNGSPNFHEQTLTSKVIHNIEDPKSLSRSKLIGHEVNAPALVWGRNHRFLLARPSRELLSHILHLRG